MKRKPSKPCKNCTHLREELDRVLAEVRLAREVFSQVQNPDAWPSGMAEDLQVHLDEYVWLDNAWHKQLGIIEDLQWRLQPWWRKVYRWAVTRIRRFLACPHCRGR